MTSRIKELSEFCDTNPLISVFILLLAWWLVIPIVAVAWLLDYEEKIND